MARTEAEVEAALALHAKIRAQGLGRAIALMAPEEVALARRLICHALQDMIAPQVAASTNFHLQPNHVVEQVGALMKISNPEVEIIGNRDVMPVRVQGNFTPTIMAASPSSPPPAPRKK